jgi:hypothetical protein
MGHFKEYRLHSDGNALAGVWCLAGYDLTRLSTGIGMFGRIRI